MGLSPCLPASPLPTFYSNPGSIPCSPLSLLSVPPNHPVSSCLRAFALAASTTLERSSPELYLQALSHHSGLSTNPRLWGWGPTSNLTPGNLTSKLFHFLKENSFCVFSEILPRMGLREGRGHVCLCSPLRPSLQRTKEVFSKHLR